MRFDEFVIVVMNLKVVESHGSKSGLSLSGKRKDSIKNLKNQAKYLVTKKNLLVQFLVKKFNPTFKVPNPLDKAEYYDYPTTSYHLDN